MLDMKRRGMVSAILLALALVLIVLQAIFRQNVSSSIRDFVNSTIVLLLLVGFAGFIFHVVRVVSLNLTYQELKKGRYDFVFQRCKWLMPLTLWDNYVFYLRGLCYLNKKIYALAQIDLERYFEADPANVLAYQYRAYFGIISKDWLRAYENSNHLVNGQPRNYQGYSYRGWASLQLKNYQMALADFNQAVLLEPNESVNYNYRAHAYLYLGEQSSATTDFIQAQKLEPQSLINNFNCEYMRLVNEEMLTESAVSFENLYQSDPSNNTAQFCLVIASVIRQEYSTALVQVENCIKREPDNYNRFLWKAIILAYLNRYDEATISIQTCFQLHPPKIELILLKGLERDHPKFYAQIQPLISQHFGEK